MRRRGKKVGQNCDKSGTKTGQTWDEIYFSLCYTGSINPRENPHPSYLPLPSCPSGNPPSPKGKVTGRTNSKLPHPRPSPWGGKVPPEAAEEGDRAEAEKAPGEKKVGQICDDVGQKRDEFYLLLCYTGYSKSQGLGGPGWGDAGKLRLLSA